jgi:Holliday junction resolvase
MRHYGAKRDDNEVEIVNALRAIGASVAHLSSKGIPDLLVCFRNKLYLMEVKKPKGKLTPDQIKFHENWNGDIYIVRTAQEAIEILNN